MATNDPPTPPTPPTLPEPVAVPPPTVAKIDDESMELAVEDLSMQEITDSDALDAVLSDLPADPAPAPAEPNYVDNAIKDLIETCKRELDATTDPTRRARLHYEIAQAYEVTPGFLAEASDHYERSLIDAPESIAAIRGARRVHLIREQLTEALPLFDAEARLTADIRRKAMLHYEKGKLIEDVAGDVTKAREAYKTALELDRDNPSVLKALERLDRDAGDLGALADTFSRQANAVSEDARHRAALIVRRAQTIERDRDNEATAAELYETALKLQPGVLGALDALKRIYHGKHQWQQLISVFEREAAQTTDSVARAIALHHIARLHRDQLGNRAEAIQALAHAIVAAPNEPLVLEDLARLYEDDDQHEKLVELLRSLVESAAERGEQVTLLHQIGDVLEGHLGKADEAIRCYQSALEVDPTHVPTLQALGKLYSDRSDWIELVSMHLNEAAATTLSARAASAHARIAEIFEVRLDQPAEAADHHARALALVPGYPASFKALTRLYLQSGQHRELVELLERAVDTSTSIPRKVAYLFKIGSIWEDALGDFAQALHAYQRIHNLAPSDLGGIQALQRAAERAKRYDILVGALELEAAGTKDIDTLVGLLHRAGTVLDEYVNDHVGALRRFRKVLELSPSFVPTLASLGRIYYRDGRWDDLLDMYDRERKVTTAKLPAVSLLFKMGDLCERRLGQVDRAIGFYHEAAKSDPTYRPALRALARLIGEKRDWPLLSEVLQLELSGLVDPNARAVTLCRMGEVYEDHLAHPAKAIECFLRALEENSGYRPPMSALARLRDKQQHWQELIKELIREGKSTSDRNRSVDVLMRQGEVWRDALDNPVKAIECFELVLSFPNGRVPALLALEPLYIAAEDWESVVRLYNEQADSFTDIEARIAALRERARIQELHSVGKLKHRLETYKALLALAPSDEPTLSAMERLARESGDGVLAQRVYKQLGVSASDPRVASGHLTRLGYALESSGQREALATFQTALDKDPDNRAAMHGLRRLADKYGDRSAIATVLGAEAAITNDRGAAAALLVDAAGIRHQLGDKTGALDDLEKALDRHPDNVDAANTLTAALRASGQKDRLVDVLSRAAGSATTSKRVSTLWRLVAEVYGELDNIGAGIAAIQRSLGAAPEDVRALDQLARLYSANEQFVEAVGVFENILSLSNDENVVIGAQIELARLFDGPIKDPDRARMSVEAVLLISPAHLEALDVLAGYQLAAGEDEAAAETTRRLVEAATDPSGRVAALVRLAQVERRREHVGAAEAALGEALVLEGPGGGAAIEFRSLAKEQRNWASYAAALAQHIERARATHPTELGRAYMELAMTYGDGMNLAEKAVSTLIDGMNVTGGSTSIAAELAGRLRRLGRMHEAIDHLRNATRADPTNIDLWRDLAMTFEYDQRVEESVLALHPIVVLGAVSEVDLGTLNSHPTRPASANAQTFDAASIAPLAFDRAFDTAAAALLESVSDGLGKLFPPNFEAHGISKRDRLRSGNSLRDLADRVSEIFGVEFDLYTHGLQRPMIAIELTEPASMVVSSQVPDLAESQQTFLLAYGAALIATRHHAILRMSSDELAMVLASATKAVRADYRMGATDDDLVARGQKIKKAVPRKWRKAMEAAAATYADSEPIDIALWRTNVERSAGRIAALVADDLPGSIEVLRFLRQLERVGPSLVTSNSEVHDLVVFWVSDAANEARRTAGMFQTIK